MQPSWFQIVGKYAFSEDGGVRSYILGIPHSVASTHHGVCTVTPALRSLAASLVRRDYGVVNPLTNNSSGIRAANCSLAAAWEATLLLQRWPSSAAVPH